MKNGAEITLNHTSNLTRNSNDETNFSYKLTVTHKQVSKIRNKLLKMVYQLI